MAGTSAGAPVTATPAVNLVGELCYFDVDVTTAAGEYQARLTLRGARRGQRLVGLSATRDVVAQLGLGTPIGFREEPVAVTGRRTRRRVEMVAGLNARSVYWRGDVPLRPDEPALLRVPAERLEAGFGFLSLELSGEDGEAGGGAAFRALPIGLGDPRGARELMMRWDDERRRYEEAFGALPTRAAASDYGGPVKKAAFLGGKLPRRTPRAD
jgi:hypothetical protein